MSFIIMMVLIIIIITCGVKILLKHTANIPTWKGIIISSIIGLLPLYLVLCFFGKMGEKENRFKKL